MKNNKQIGFTLLELMIVVVIMAILVKVAFNSYEDSIRKGRRASAKADLVALTQDYERYYTINNTYAGFYATLPSSRLTSPSQGTTFYYDIDESSAATQTTYTLRASPRAGPQANDKCGKLTITHAGVKGMTNTIGSPTVSDCW